MATMTFSFSVPLAGSPATGLTTIVGTAGGVPASINVDDGQLDNQFAVGDSVVTSTPGQAGTYVGSFGNGIVIQGDFGLETPPSSFLLFTNDSTLTAAAPVALDTDPFLVCFLSGTLIATEAGEIAVESLRIGDMVRTASGALRAVQWIGTGSVPPARGGRSAATPVIVRKGAIADNVPHRDLHITKNHGLFFRDGGGALIPAEFLVNHRSIVWDDHSREDSIYHVELLTHDLLIANGAPAESYRDDGNRWLFHNADSGRGCAPQPPCVPVLTAGRMVDDIWRRLLDRAGTRPGFPLTSDPDVHLMADGRRADPHARTGGGRYLFRLPKIQGEVRVVSRAGAPSELGLSRDPRPLGIAVRSITVRGPSRAHVVHASDVRLRTGFHGYEPDEGIRWTNGDGLLPADLFKARTGAVEVELTTAGTTLYLDEGRPPDRSIRP